MESVLAHHLALGLPEQEDAKKGEVIHSGHFMISSVADQDELDEDDSHDRDSPVHHDEVIRLRKGYDFSEVRKETQNTYQFGHRSTNQITIDASLARLFECMSLAYRGRMVVSPKWKNFKGMRLSVKDKIRLNNAIWREWHIRFIMRRSRSKVSFVQFATPLDNESDYDSHSKPEAVVMEGKYWKRRIETVVAEYKKWRAFFMDKLQQSDHPGLTWVSNQSPATPESINTDFMKHDDPSFMDFTSQLFNRFSQPFQFPNPREIAQQATNSDMIQPGLLQLQPSLEDFMDPLDSLQDFFSPTRKSPLASSSNNVSLFYSGNNTQPPVQNQDFNTALMTPNDLTGHGIEEPSLEELVQRVTGEDPNMCIPETSANIQPMQQQEPAQIQMQTGNNTNYGVSDLMLTQASQKMFPNAIPNQFQNTMIASTSPMMISKKHQSTPTISQVITAHSQHLHQQSDDPVSHHDHMKHTVMPPPAKKAPRRKSANRIYGNNMASNNVNPTASPIGVNIAPNQTLNSNDMSIPMNYQIGANNQGQPQLHTNFSTTQPQVIITPQIGTYTVNQQTNQMQVDKVDHTQQIMPNLPAMQTTSRGIGNAGVNTNSNNLEAALNMRRENTQVPALIMTMQRNHANQAPNNFDQPPQKKQILNQHAPEIVIKRSSSTNTSIQQTVCPTRQHQELIKLLSGRQANVYKMPTSNLQVPNISSPLEKERREAQLKKVEEQAANFNPFQNSVLRAAAQLVVTSQPQNVASANMNALSQNTVPNLSAMDLIFATVNTPTTVKESTPAKKKTTKTWPSQSSTHVTTMDTDDLPMSVKEDFSSVMEMHERKSSFSDVTSPASSTASNTSSDQRNCHFTAEQKRRCNIKHLCDRLQEILPEVSNHPSQKVSKAVLLNKSCNHIRQLQTARQQTTAEIQQLKKNIELLNEDICKFQQQLPATGVPVSRHRGNRMQVIFNEWVKDRTLQDWKFFIFSTIIQPLFATYDQTVSVASLEELCRTCLIWLEKSCSLPSLRTGVVNSLQELGTTTSILTDPSNLRQQAESAVQQSSRRSSNSS